MIKKIIVGGEGGWDYVSVSVDDRRLSLSLSWQLFKYLIDTCDMQQVYSKETQELREANTRAQLEILKQQINPHFLFNAHSTIKSLIRIQDPNAEKFVMNLSDLSSSPQGY